jgi:hypothetical protein
MKGPAFLNAWEKPRCRSPDVLFAKEHDQPCGFAVVTGIFGSTLEEGLFAIDPAGYVGALFVGDED